MGGCVGEGGSAAYLRGDTFDRMAFECGTARQKDADEEVIVE